MATKCAGINLTLKRNSMIYRSTMGYLNVSHFSFILNLAENRRPSIRKLCQTLEDDGGIRMRHDGEKAILDDDEVSRPYLVSCDRADEYTHAFAVPLTLGDPAVIQFGATASGRARVSHVRVYSCDLSGNRGYIGDTLVRYLWQCLNDGEEFSDDQTTLTRMEATYLLKGLCLDDVQIEHQGNYAFAKETVMTKTKQLCGYQFGSRLMDEGPAELPAQGYTRSVRKVSSWRQTREIALFDQEQEGDELPAICISWRLPQPTTNRALALRNPFDGLSIRQRAGIGKKSVAIECWKPQGAWANVLEHAAESKGKANY